MSLATLISCDGLDLDAPEHTKCVCGHCRHQHTSDMWCWAGVPEAEIYPEFCECERYVEDDAVIRLKREGPTEWQS